MIIDYETPSVKEIAFFGAQVICSSPTSSWDDVDREDDDDW
jgi:hypothetical protein